MITLQGIIITYIIWADTAWLLTYALFENCFHSPLMQINLKRLGKNIFCLNFPLTVTSNTP